MQFFAIENRCNQMHHSRQVNQNYRLKNWPSHQDFVKEHPSYGGK
jgi:hypothetical protein